MKCSISVYPFYNVSGVCLISTQLVCNQIYAKFSYTLVVGRLFPFPSPENIHVSYIWRVLSNLEHKILILLSLISQSRTFSGGSHWFFTICSVSFHAQSIVLWFSIHSCSCTVIGTQCTSGQAKPSRTLRHTWHHPRSTSGIPLVNFFHSHFFYVTKILFFGPLLGVVMKVFDFLLFFLFINSVSYFCIRRKSNSFTA